MVARPQIASCFRLSYLCLSTALALLLMLAPGEGLGADDDGGFGCTLGCRFPGTVGRGVECPCTPFFNVCDCGPSCVGTQAWFWFKKIPTEAEAAPCAPVCGNMVCEELIVDCKVLCDAVNPYELCAGGSPPPATGRCLTISPKTVQSHSASGGFNNPQSIQLCCPEGKVVIGCTKTGDYGCQPGDIVGPPPTCLSTWECQCPLIEIQCGDGPTCQPPEVPCGSGCCGPGQGCIDDSCCPGERVCGSGDDQVCCQEGYQCISNACCGGSRVPCGPPESRVCCAEGDSCHEGECRPPTTPPTPTPTPAGGAGRGIFLRE